MFSIRATNRALAACLLALPLGTAAADGLQALLTPSSATGAVPYVVTGERVTYNAQTGEGRAEGNARLRGGADDIAADVVRYVKPTDMAYAEGNVVAKRGDDTLRADFLDMNLSNHVAHARGNVVLTRGTNVWTGSSLTYDFETRHASADAFTAWTPPYRILADRGEQEGTNRLVLRNVLLTTCTNEAHCLHFALRARKATLIEGESLRLSGVTWRLGPIPILYLPVWYRDLDAGMGFHVTPGLASRWGAYVLSTYRCRLAPGLKSTTHFDYRARRGFAGGEDVSWVSRSGACRGSVHGYYADDTDPFDEYDDPAAKNLDSQRYRLRLANDWVPADRDRLLVRLDYLSDTDVYEDFYRREYHSGIQPENDVTYSHTAPFYSANAQWARRLNTFYTAVNRQPELSVDLMSRELGASRFYYQGRVSAARLEQVFADVLNADPYDAVRLDSANSISRPLNMFGFLTAVPSAGYRLTYYSRTPERETTDTNGFTRVEGGDSAFRTVPDVGFGLSFRAFRVWPDAERPYRHVVEPYAQYTWVGEPSVRPFELFPFDGVDQIDRSQGVRLGVRNLLQTKSANESVNLADVNLYTDIPVGPLAQGQERVDVFVLKAELTPCKPLRIDLESQYSRVEGAILLLDGRLGYDAGGWWRAGVSYVSRYERYRVLETDLAIRPTKAWELGALTRYEFEEGRLDEQAASLAYKTDCLRFGLHGGFVPGYDLPDGDRRPDEWTVRMDIVLTAFPEIGISARDSW